MMMVRYVYYSHFSRLLCNDKYTDNISNKQVHEVFYELQAYYSILKFRKM